MQAVYMRVEVLLQPKTLWCFRIRLADGVIMNWLPGTTAHIDYKVSDRGQYWLQDADGNDIAKYDMLYVPDSFLCYGAVGNGDFIFMDIGPDGAIAKYTQPIIDPSAWNTKMKNFGPNYPCTGIKYEKR